MMGEKRERGRWNDKDETRGRGRGGDKRGRGGRGGNRRKNQNDEDNGQVWDGGMAPLLKTMNNGPSDRIPTPPPPPSIRSGVSYVPRGISHDPAGISHASTRNSITDQMSKSRAPPRVPQVRPPFREHQKPTETTAADTDEKETSDEFFSKIAAVDQFSMTKPDFVSDKSKLFNFCDQSVIPFSVRYL